MGEAEGAALGWVAFQQRANRSNVAGLHLVKESLKISHPNAKSWTLMGSLPLTAQADGHTRLLVVALALGEA